MSKFREKAEAQTEELIGRMLGDELLVKEGQQRSRKAEAETGSSEDQASGADQGIVRDERGQEQPKEKARAQQVSRADTGGDPPGKKM